MGRSSSFGAHEDCELLHAVDVGHGVAEAAGDVGVAVAVELAFEGLVGEDLHVGSGVSVLADVNLEGSLVLVDLHPYF